MSIGLAALMLAVSMGAFGYLACLPRFRQRKALRTGGMICAAAVSLGLAVYIASAALLLGANH